MKTFTFTAEQIKDIYRAGIAHGGDEATAYEHGSSTHRDQFENCVDAVFDIVNDGKSWKNYDYVTWNTVKEWFK